MATSIRDIARLGNRIRKLQLRNSTDLICHQLMCEHLGTVCTCRLALVLGRVPLLQDLDLSNNQLQTLPNAVYELKSLKTLNVQQNHLTTLSTELEKLTDLEIINVGYNKIETLPLEQLELLPKLKTLQVTGNCDLIENMKTLNISKQLQAKIVLEEVDQSTH